MVGRLKHREGEPGRGGLADPPGPGPHGLEVGREIDSGGPVDPDDVGPAPPGDEGIGLHKDAAVLHGGADQPLGGPGSAQPAPDDGREAPTGHEADLFGSGPYAGCDGLTGGVPQESGAAPLPVEPGGVRPAGIGRHGPGLPGRRVEGLTGGGVEEARGWRRGGHVGDATSPAASGTAQTARCRAYGSPRGGVGDTAAGGRAP